MNHHVERTLFLHGGTGGQQPRWGCSLAWGSRIVPCSAPSLWFGFLPACHSCQGQGGVSLRGGLLPPDPGLSLLRLLPPRSHYPPIMSDDARQKYKQDFDTDLKHYKQLCAEMDGINDQINQLSKQLDLLPEDTLQYQVGPQKKGSHGPRGARPALSLRKGAAAGEGPRPRRPFRPQCPNRGGVGSLLWNWAARSARLFPGICGKGCSIAQWPGAT